VDYVVTDVRELPSGHFEVSWTLLHGSGHRGKLLVLRHSLEIIDQLVQSHVDRVKLPPTGPR
jgi:hypothetical protein